MKKICYPKYSYIIYFILSIVLMLFSTFPLFVNTGEKMIYKLVWIITMIIMSFLLLIAGLLNYQTYTIISKKIIVRNAFRVIIELDLDKIVYEVVELNTYFSWIISIPKKWICIYKKSEKLVRFTSGCSNKKGKQRLQIIYSDISIKELTKNNVEQLKQINIEK